MTTSRYWIGAVVDGDSGARTRMERASSWTHHVTTIKLGRRSETSPPRHFAGHYQARRHRRRVGLLGSLPGSRTVVRHDRRDSFVRSDLLTRVALANCASDFGARRQACAHVGSLGRSEAFDARSVELFVHASSLGRHVWNDDNLGALAMCSNAPENAPGSTALPIAFMRPFRRANQRVLSAQTKATTPVLGTARAMPSPASPGPDFRHT